MGAYNYGRASVLLAESRAFRDGMGAALRSGFYILEVEGDNSFVITAFNKELEIPWHIKTIMQDIQVLAQQAHFIQVTHICCEANMAADWLSKFGHSITDKWRSNHCDNSQLRTIVQEDKIARTLVRRGT